MESCVKPEGSLDLLSQLEGSSTEQLTDVVIDPLSHNLTIHSPAKPRNVDGDERADGLQSAVQSSKASRKGGAGVRFGAAGGSNWTDSVARSKRALASGQKNTKDGLPKRSFVDRRIVPMSQLLTSHAPV